LGSLTASQVAALRKLATITPEEWAAIRAAVAQISATVAGEEPPPVPVAGTMAWGAKVSPTFRERVKWIAQELFDYPEADDDLMSCMAWESGRTFSASKRNLAGSGATGLIQFMPSTAQKLGTTTDKLAAMTAEDQLKFVYKYFRPWGKVPGRPSPITGLNDMYMAILWPAGVGKPDSYVLWDRASMPTTFRQNAGLDLNKDGSITKAECAAKLHAMKTEGMRFAA
jgi:hypothetical protein